MGLEYLDIRFYLIFYTIIFLYGIVIGSFLNVCIYRLPANESLTKRASHCMTCGAKIRKRDLIPIFSWLFLKGKCHNCGEKIASRYPIVEALTGIMFVISFAVFSDLSNDSFFAGLISPLIMSLFFAALIVVGFMDWDTLEIDLRVLLFIALLAIPSILLTDALTIKQRIIGALCVSIPFFLIGEISGAVIKKRTGEKVRGIELGDTVLMAASGLLIGPSAIVVSAFLGIMLAAVCGIIYKKVTGESKFAFGPYLSMGLALGSIFGNSLAEWYISYITQMSEI